MAAFIILWFDSLSGISLDQPLVTSCGTGVTACVLALVRLSVSWSLEIYFPNGKWCFYNFFSHFRAFIASAKLMSRYMMDHGPNGAPIQTLQLQLLRLSHLSWPWRTLDCTSPVPCLGIRSLLVIAVNAETENLKCHIHALVNYDIIISLAEVHFLGATTIMKCQKRKICYQVSCSTTSMENFQLTVHCTAYMIMNT